MCTARNSAILTTASKLKDTVPHLSFTELPLCTFFIRITGSTVVLKEFYFDSVNILRGTLQFPLKLQKNLSVKGITHFALGLILNGDTQSSWTSPSYLL